MSPGEPVVRAQPPSGPQSRAWPRAEPQRPPRPHLGSLSLKQQGGAAAAVRGALGPEPAGAHASPGSRQGRSRRPWPLTPFLALGLDPHTAAAAAQSGGDGQGPAAPAASARLLEGSGRSQAVPRQRTWEAQDRSPLRCQWPRAVGRRYLRRSRPVVGPAGSASRDPRGQQAPARGPTVTGSGPSSCRCRCSAGLAVNDAFSQTAYGLGGAGLAGGAGSRPDGPPPTPRRPARARREPGSGSRRGPGFRAAYGPLAQPRGAHSRQVRELGGGT